MLEELGAGRFGRVYRSQEEGTGRPVAVRVFDHGLAPDQSAGLAAALRRLVDAPLDHPSIAAPSACGREGDTPWLAEAYVDGEPLSAVIIREGANALADVMLLITRIAGALDFAAAAGVYHGCLQPREILLSDNATHLIGVGVMQALDAAGADVTIRGPYASPQRVGGGVVTRADDIYALAAITFELLYGRPLKDRSALRAMMLPLDGVDQDRLRDVLEGSLSSDPDERPRTALEFAAALQKAIVDSERPQPVSPPLVASIDAPPDLADMPLRDEFASSADVAEPVVMRAPFAAALAETEALPNTRSNGRLFGLAATLAIGLLTGFAGGFLVGQRGDPLPLPRTSARVTVPRPEAAAPSAAIGERFTESAVVSEPVVAPANDVERIERPERPERSVPPDEGRLLIRSVPSGARVLVNGEARGVTPLAVRALPLGAHTVEVMHLDYQTQQQRVSLTSDGPAHSIDFALQAVTGRLKPAPTAAGVSNSSEPAGAGSAVGGSVGAGFSRPASTPTQPGALRIESRPIGARVFVDNELVGTTPLLIPEVTAGAHAVRLDLPGYRPWATSVQIAGGARARVAASLER